MFCILWARAWVQIDSIGLPILSVSITFYTLWKHARLCIDCFHWIVITEHLDCVSHAL